MNLLKYPIHTQMDKHVMHYLQIIFPDSHRCWSHTGGIWSEKPTQMSPNQPTEHDLQLSSEVREQLTTPNIMLLLISPGGGNLVL